MKSIRSKFLAVAVLVMFATFSSHAQIVVRVRPPRPKVVVTARPPRPSVAHVWVDEDWRPQGATYVYSGGYWAAPPRPHARWTRGHWVHTRRGYQWRPGHWR